MPAIRLLFLWHMHQPYYKNLVTGEYRLPWVRLHALKDYYGMVKLLDEFPDLHQTFNLVPSLIAQIQDYVRGNAQDPFLSLASRPAADLSRQERESALWYLFQANLQNMIGRYPRYRELWERFQNLSGIPAQAAPLLKDSDITDLQVLSQIAWFDELWLEDPSISELVRKGRNYTREDQSFVIGKQKEFLAQVLPAYAAAQRRGVIEISTSPFYHPILPLLCDTDAGAASHPGMTLPSRRFRHPEDAREQIVRGLALHEQVFGVRPRGMWPSEGSVSNEVLTIAHDAGIEWVATDEGVLGRSLGSLFRRDDSGKLDHDSAGKLYQAYRWEQGSATMSMVFRDHSLSDLIGFVYSGVPAKDAAEDFIRRIKGSCAPLLEQGKDAVLPIIMDGENAWEYYPKSGREFLRRLYDAIQADRSFAALTISEGLQREQAPQKLSSIVPGSWINANFDVWIGAPEDDLAWDYLSAAHDFFTGHSPRASEDQRELAFQELLIAEGSDWNWWYGPEHHSANDRDFDELYRKHLSNVYHALGAEPPDALAQPISGRDIKLQFTPQTAYISPRLNKGNGGASPGYFDWLGAAIHVADRRSSAMHGKLFLLDTGYAGIDHQNLYCRLDFMHNASDWVTEDSRLVVAIKSLSAGGAKPERNFKLEASFSATTVQDWTFSENGGRQKQEEVMVVFRRESILECRIPLLALDAKAGALLRLRFSLWRGQLPLDALPQEGYIEVQVVPEEDLSAVAYAKP
ncbi:MAG TPA: glycoside hydrolase family 57 protein [Candidatus Angelobacter sp.]|nr:glycoside hydrolase family 57 protein [Candidatus Angelobacter sp.]